MTNYRIHAAKIAQGSSKEFDGWIDMAIEAKGYQSIAYYAQRSQVDNTLHSETTVRQYCSFIAKGIEMFGTRSKLVNAYDEEYTYRNISSLRSFITSETKKREDDKPASKKKPAKRVETYLVKKAMRNAGIPVSKIDLVMFALATKK